MKIEYIHSHVNNPAGDLCKTDIATFLLGLPTIGLAIRQAKLIPPLCVVNEVLVSGKVDAGMSGCFQWEPITVDEAEYKAIQDSLIGNIGEGASVSDQGNVSLTKWMSQAMKHFRKKT